MTASFLGDARATHSRIVLGDFEVTSVLDGHVAREGVHPTFGNDQTFEAFAAYAASRHMPAERFEHVFVPSLVNTGEALVLFDTGFGAMGRDMMGAGRLEERLAEAGYTSEDVDVVALTHCHPDHIAGLWAGDKPTYPNARYAIGRLEYDAWQSGAALPEARLPHRDLFLKVVPPLAEKMTFLEDGDSVVSGITAVATHGHSIGHMSYMVESGGKSLLLWGDLANHAIFSVERPEWQVVFDDVKDLAVETRKRVLDWVATDNLPVLGFHMPFPSMGFVERAGDSYRWVPDNYRLRV